MSYVLDALRRADAERRRGALPDLHAHPLPGPAAEAAPVGPAGGRRTPWRMAFGVAVVAFAGVLAWWALRSTGGATDPPMAARPPTPGAMRSTLPATPPAADVRPAPAPVLARPAVPAPTADTSPPDLPPPGRAQPVPPRPVGARPGARAAALDPEAAGEAALAPPKASVPNGAPPPGITVVPNANAGGGGEVVRSVDALSPALRSQLPPLVFGGATDSPSAAARMLIVNGQVAREGDEIAPGLVLERIMLRSARMRFRGQRFEIAY